MIADGGGAADAQPKARAFISYSRKDLAFAQQLETTLKARGFETLIDRTEIYAFEDWWKRIETLIERADTVIFVLSPDAVTSDVALREVSYAGSLNKRFAPVVYRRVEDGAVPEALRRLNFIFFDDPTRFEAGADTLVEALQTDIGWMRRHTELGEAARRWVETGRPDGLLLRSPVLEQAEAWIAYRPHGAPPPSAETQSFIAASRKFERERQKAEVRARAWRRRAQAAIYAMLVGIIAGLVGWINQSTIKEEWRWYTVTRPYMVAQIRPYVLSAAREQALKPRDSFKECAQDCPEMIVVPAGSFVMGSPPTEKPRSANEDPQHNVAFAHPFAVSKFQVTFAEWDACVAYGDCAAGVSDSGFGRGRQPAMNTTWNEAQQYAVWLSKMTGKTYRLLSEAEYEYAARAGTQTAYPWGDDVKLNGTAMANCNGCGSQWDFKQPAPVGSFPPNKFGLYDMAGNLFQWLADCLHGNYDKAPHDGSAWTEGENCNSRIIRGGAWASNPPDLRSAARNWIPADLRSDAVGFRVARTLAGAGAR